MAGTELERGDLLIQNARLIDGTGALPKTGVSILISDGRIAAIGRKVGGHNVEKLDAQGLTVLPGLIDAHVHLYSVPGAFCRGDSLEVIRQLQRIHLRAYLACGVTTLLDVGTPSADEARTIQGWLSAGHPGPRVFFLSPGFSPGGYPPRGTGFPAGFGPPVSSPQDVEQRFEESEGLDAVGVKVFLESGFGAERWRIHPPEVRKAIQEGAAERGLPLYVHSWTEADTNVALDMGVYTLAHAHGLASDEIIARAKAQSTYVMSTSSVPDANSIHEEPDRLDDPLVQLVVPKAELDTARQPGSWDKLARGTAIMLSSEDASEDELAAMAQSIYGDLSAQVLQRTEAIAKLHSAGIPIVAGSDSGNWPLIPYFFHGPTMLREIELLGESGLSAMEAIQAATVVPARMLNKSREIGTVEVGTVEVGTVEVGKQADLVIVREDPLEDLRALRSIEWTVQRGIARSPREWMEAEAGPLES